MNNPLAQKAQYYLNESHRLSEELKNETEYSELLENILVELIGEEAFYGLFEDIQTKQRAEQSRGQIAAARRRANRDSQRAYEEGESGSAASAANAHDIAANSAWEEIAAVARDRKEKLDKTNLYGLGGKIVRRLPKRSTKK